MIEPAAHRRVHDRARGSAAAFLEQGEGAPQERIKKILEHSHAYGRAVNVLPLGGRCVLPTTISHVDLLRVLREVDPELARKADDPHAMLLPREK